MLPAAAAERLTPGEEGWWLVFLMPQRMASWLVERYFPWSVAAVVALVWMGPRRWMRSPVAPAILWLGVLVMAYLPLPGKGAGDLLATLPPLACVTVLFFVMDQARWPVPTWLVGAVATGMILAVCSREVTFSSTAWDGQGVKVAAFARDARSIVGEDAVAFGPDARKMPVAPLMGRHPQLETAPPAWTVQLAADLPPNARAASEPIRTSAGQQRRLVLVPVKP
jgi:hypothetical protein